MADTKTSLARDGTMQVTAKEGISYLESEGKDTLLKMQGLKDSAPEKPSVARDGTMAATAKEAQVILGKNRPDEDAKTRGQQSQIDEANKEPEPPAKKPKMAKGITMVGTAKEADRLLGDKKPDADAMTRGQQKKIDEISKEVPASPAKKPKMAKMGTMAATAKEAKAYYIGKDKLGDTRSESKTLQSKPGQPKKMSSMARTVHESSYVVPDLDVSEGRRTRSQSRGDQPKPSMKRAGTMQKTAKEGKSFLKRGRKSKKAKDVVEEEEEESDE